MQNNTRIKKKQSEDKRTHSFPKRMHPIQQNYTADNFHFCLYTSIKAHRGHRNRQIFQYQLEAQGMVL